MTHEHDQHAAGHLTFPGGGIITSSEPLPQDWTVEGPVVQKAPGAPAGAHLMPSGNWVQMADPRTLDRNAKREIITGASAIDDAATRAFYITDQLHRRLVTAWSYPYPLPSADIDSLGRLPLEDDEAIGDLLDDARKVLFPRTVVTPDDHADPESPTAPSGE